MASQSIAFDEYRKIDAVSASALKHLLVSPRKYRWEMDHPSEETDAMRLGRATHTAVLEPDKFALEYVVWSDGVRRGKKWDSFCEANARKTILTEAQYHECIAVRDAVRSDPLAASLIQGGKAEQSIRWTHYRTGREIKSRLDYVGPVLVDLKTTRDASEHRFCADGERRGYSMQLALYADGVAEVMRRTPPVWIVAAENKPPYDVTCYELPEDVLARGRRQYEAALDLLAECERADRWPGASRGEPRVYRVPRYLETQDEETEDF